MQLLQADAFDFSSLPPGFEGALDLSELKRLTPGQMTELTKLMAEVGRRAGMRGQGSVLVGVRLLPGGTSRWPFRRRRVQDHPGAGPRLRSEGGGDERQEP